MTQQPLPSLPKRSKVRVWMAVLVWACAGLGLLRYSSLNGAFFAFILGVVVYGRRPPAVARRANEHEDA